MGSLETAANDMKSALAVHHIDNQGVTNLPDVARTHHEAGKDVRHFLDDQGITINQLPTPTKSYEQLLREQVLREMLAEQDNSGLWAQLQECNDEAE